MVLQPSLLLVVDCARRIIVTLTKYLLVIFDRIFYVMNRVVPVQQEDNGGEEVRSTLPCESSPYHPWVQNLVILYDKEDLVGQGTSNVQYANRYKKYEQFDPGLEVLAIVCLQYLLTSFVRSYAMC